MAAPKNAKLARESRDRLRSFNARQAMHERKRNRRRKDNLTWGLVAGAAILVAVGSQVGLAITGGGGSASPSASGLSLPDKSLAQDKTWNATLGIDGVALTVELDGAQAPQAVSSTISLAQQGFYNSLTCHRLTTDGIFVLQCGDPNGDGSGGPGYSYGPIENAPVDNLYPAGTIAMARQGNNAASQGSQFFIVYKDSMIPSDTAGGYTVIGHITGGLPELESTVISQGVADESTDGHPVAPAVIQYFDILPGS